MDPQMDAMVRICVLPAQEDSGDNFAPSHIMVREKPQNDSNVRLDAGHLREPRQQQVPAADLSSLELQEVMGVRCAGSCGGRLLQLNATVSASQRQSEQSSWSDADERAVDDGLLSLSTHISTQVGDSYNGDSDSSGGDDPGFRGRKRTRPSAAHTQDRCKHAEHARVVLRETKATLRADEIVGRTLLLF
ncbi:hypothetical protein VaNZ11_013297 [Volvox africanus]|uniref:Uncharacterized protein n=1 Tax=Volvox africanus TaxID=51714 RepID=A0ABQ5SGL1_9CHLO|nr:hypothetical protein VaNZ11_013297 [Volvox africanus]